MSHSKCFFKFIGVFLVLFLTGMFSSFLNGSTLYVKQSCSGSGCYTTISGALAAANDGDTIIMDPGTWYEDVVISKRITLEGYHMFSTYIYGVSCSSTSDVMTITANNVVIRNLTVGGCGGSSTAIYCGIKVVGDNCILENVIAAESYRNIYLYGANNTIIRNCWISTTWETDEEITLLGATNSKIYNNQIFRANTTENAGFGILLIGSGTTGNYIYSNDIFRHEYGVYMWMTDENEISSNHIKDNDYGIFTDTASQNNFIANKIESNAEGLYLYNASNSNNIHRNNFINNIINNAYIDNTLSSFPCVNNNWYDTVNLVGNYWGACTDSDNNGICDNTYTIPCSNSCSDSDDYPLANFFYVMCGNVDGSSDGLITAADIDYLICFVYENCATPLPPIPRCSGDVNGDGIISLSDISALIGHVYNSEPAPSGCLCN